jgi:hypothetical protein
LIRRLVKPHVDDSVQQPAAVNDADRMEVQTLCLGGG